jgi:Flp pilus assembly pilin Flp
VTSAEYIVLAAVLVLGLVAGVSMFRSNVGSSLEAEGTAVDELARGQVAEVRARYDEPAAALAEAQAAPLSADAPAAPEERVLAAAPPPPVMPPMAAPARARAEPGAEILIYRQSAKSSTQVIIKEGGKVVGGYFGNADAAGARDAVTGLLQSDYQSGTQGPLRDGDYWLKPKDNYDPKTDLLVDKVPSLTAPGLKPGQVSAGSPPVYRMHPTGNSRGCQTAPREWALRIWDLMDKHQDNGGVRVRIITQRTPKAIPVETSLRKGKERPFFTSEARAQEAAKARGKGGSKDKPAKDKPEGERRRGWFR